MSKKAPNDGNKKKKKEEEEEEEKKEVRSGCDNRSADPLNRSNNDRSPLFCFFWFSRPVV